MLKTILENSVLEVGGHKFAITYFRILNDAGTELYTGEVVISPSDRLIWDDASLNKLKTRVHLELPLALAFRDHNSRVAPLAVPAYLRKPPHSRSGN